MAVRRTTFLRQFFDGVCQSEQMYEWQGEWINKWTSECFSKRYQLKLAENYINSYAFFVFFTNCLLNQN